MIIFIHTKSFILGKFYCKGLTPSHTAAGTGNLSLLKKIQQYTNEKNPGDLDGWTCLHAAAQNGHLDVFKFLMEIAEEKEPKTYQKETPYHFAVRENQWEICKYIFENLDDILHPLQSPSWGDRLYDFQNPFR